MIIVTGLAGAFGELGLLKDGYESNKTLSISYVLSQLVYALHVVIFILVFGIDGISEQFLEMMTADKAQEVAGFCFNPVNLIIVATLQIGVGFFSFFLGSKIYNKFFGKHRKKDKSKLGE